MTVGCRRLLPRARRSDRYCLTAPGQDQNALASASLPDDEPPPESSSPWLQPSRDRGA
jgi:hypothetical protein